MSSNDSVFDPARRQVLPLTAAVQGPRFRRRQWEISQQVREILDSWDGPPPPTRAKPERDIDPAESIIMSGNVIENRMTTGAHVVRQRRVTDLDPLPELAIAEPFAVVPDTSVRDAAGQALAALNERKPHARRSHRLNRPTPKPSRATRPDMVTVAIVLGGLVIVALVIAARGSLL